MTERVLILGAGHAGGATAISLRDMGFSGSICVIGDEKSLPYERPSLSKEYLSGAESEPVWLGTEDRWTLLDVDFRLSSTAQKIDRDARQVHLADGSSLDYDHLVLATGGKVRRLPLPHLPQVHYLRTTEDARELAAAAQPGMKVLVVGGGVIGLEAASTLQKLGLSVTVIETGDRILGRNIPEEAAGWLSEAHARDGIEIRLNCALTTLEPRAQGGVTASLSDGTTLDADLVVVGIGIIPCAEAAEQAGLTLQGGVVVNDQYRSIDDAHIWAVGDLAVRRRDGALGRMETWAHAQSSARAAALSILGLAPEPEPAPWFWTAQCGHNLQILGDPSKADGVIEVGPGVRHYVRNGLLVGAACLDQPRAFAGARRQLGKPVAAEAAIISLSMPLPHAA